MSAHLSDVERWHGEAVQLCLASTEHASGVGHHRADAYGPCTTHLDAAQYVAARVAAAVAAEREAWVGKIEALADAWADDTGIEGYINLGEAEDRLRALIAEARS